MAKDKVLQSDEDDVTLVKEIIFVIQGSMLSKRRKYCMLQISYSPLQYCCLDYKYIAFIVSLWLRPFVSGSH